MQKSSIHHLRCLAKVTRADLLEQRVHSREVPLHAPEGLQYPAPLASDL